MEFPFSLKGGYYWGNCVHILIGFRRVLSSYFQVIVTYYFLSLMLAFNRLIDDEKLMDALALSDRFLRNGASDQLLQLLIENGEENQLVSGHSQGYGGNSIWSTSWQYCLRLKDKQLAARLALKYVTFFF